MISLIIISSLNRATANSVSCYLKSCDLILFDVDSSVSWFSWVVARPEKRSFYWQGPCLSGIGMKQSIHHSLIWNLACIMETRKVFWINILLLINLFILHRYRNWCSKLNRKWLSWDMAKKYCRYGHFIKTERFFFPKNTLLMCYIFFRNSDSHHIYLYSKQWFIKQGGIEKLMK